MVGRAKINFCMIVKDEQKRVRTCLKSIRDYAYRTVILDTGSTDKTVRYCRGYSNEVTVKPWKGKWDFSKARNIGFGYAEKGGGNWNFVIDADESLHSQQDGDILLQAAIEGMRNGIDGFEVRVHSVFKHIGYVGTGAPTVRMFRNDGTWRYAGYVHNQLQIHGHVALLPVTLDHSGYDLTPEERAKKHARTCTLLLQNVHETHGKASFPWYNLVKEYNFHKQWHKSLRCVERALPILAKQDRLKRDNPLCNIYHFAAHAAIQSAQYGRAIEYTRQGLEAIDDFPDFWFNLVQVYAYTDDIEEMDKAFIEYEKSVKNYANTNFVQETCRLDYLAHAYFYRGTAYDRAGDIDKAQHLMERAREENPLWAAPALILGRIHRVHHEDAKEALRNYGKAVELDPSGTNLAELAEMFYAVGEKEKAAQWMNWAAGKYGVEGNLAKTEEAKRWIEKYVTEETAIDTIEKGGKGE